MLRGCQREMIVLQTRDSALFECAWFVLRQEKPCVGAEDMLAEAERIVAESGRGDRRRKRDGKWPCFWLGLFCGAVFFAIIWLLLRL
ncbi:MAG: hypothetical protein J6L87_01400 [Clostridia bacterium]|nr:hypothetical protein [Clostridia bacterium]